MYSLAWTMGLQMIIALPDQINNWENNWIIEDTYQVFALLNRAIHIDLDTGPIHAERSIAVPSLFPSARYICLGGKMHYALASAILHGSNKAPLISLSLNNVQEGGLFASGRASTSRVYSGMARTESLICPLLKRSGPKTLCLCRWPQDACGVS